MKNKVNLFLANPYRSINIIFIGIILLIFLYSAIFSPEKERYPIHSAHEFLTGTGSLSSGLSRGFSSIVRWKFDEAQNYNPLSLRIFMFFLIQLFLRIFFVFYSRNSAKSTLKYIIIPDCIISGVLFLVFFEPFWRELFCL